MLNLKKYSNGRFFDTDKKSYIKAEDLAAMIQKGEEIKVTLTKTGKDITDEVIARYTKNGTDPKGRKNGKSAKKEIPFIKTDKLVKWVGDIVDKKINKVLEVVKLPSKQQVEQLDENIQALNKKIDELKRVAEKKTTAKKETEPVTRKKDKSELKKENKPAAGQGAPVEKEPVKKNETPELVTKTDKSPEIFTIKA